MMWCARNPAPPVMRYFMGLVLGIWVFVAIVGLGGGEMWGELCRIIL